MRAGRVVALLGLLWKLAGPLEAQSVLIDFEHFPGPDGVLGTADDVPVPCTTAIPLSGQYASVGITFTLGLMECAPGLFPPGAIFASASATAATFSVPVREITMASNSFWNATLVAYDSDDNVAATFVLPHPSPGSFYFRGTLSVATARPIARFTVLPDDSDNILNLDEIAFGPGEPLDFFALTPCRLFDTRTPSHAPPLAAGGDRAFDVAGSCGVPPTAKAISVNVAVTEPTAAGHIRLSPTETPGPLSSSVNYNIGETRSNNAIVALSPAASFTARCVQASGTVHFVLDVNGYFE